MGRVFFVLLLWFAGSASAWAQDGMQFKAYPPDTLIEKVMGQHAWKIYVQQAR